MPTERIPDEVRESLRDLIPDYTGPTDPFARVGVAVRRRRTRNRLLTTASAACLALVVVGVSVTVGTLAGDRADKPDNRPAAAPPTGSSASPGSGNVTPPEPRGRRFTVVTGSLDGQGWRFSATRLSTGAQRCLWSGDPLFGHGLATCFDDWTPGDPTAWVRLGDFGDTLTVVLGVAPAGADQVRIAFTDGPTETIPALVTDLDPDAAFFALVRPGDLGVQSVTALDAAGNELEDPVTEPYQVDCTPTASRACASELPDPGPS